MIHDVRGNILESQVQTLVNPVNCRGHMGKGLAKAFKDRWPEMFRDYKEACRQGNVRPGVPFLYHGADRWILCVPTKDDWKKPSTYEMVDAGLQAIRDQSRAWGITSLAIPALGCGLGGLDWNKVRQLIDARLSELPFEIEVYPPQDDPS